MAQQESDESRRPAVTGLHHCGDPEQDHLIDEIQHPEQTRALYEMAGRGTEVAG